MGCRHCDHGHADARPGAGSLGVRFLSERHHARVLNSLTGRLPALPCRRPVEIGASGDGPGEGLDAVNRENDQSREIQTGRHSFRCADYSQPPPTTTG